MASMLATDSAHGEEKMARLVCFFLVALGLCVPVLTIYLTGADPGAAGYASGRGYGLSIIAIVLVIVVARSMPPDRRVRAYFLVSAVVLALNGWSSFKITRDARVDREIASARPTINAIMQAAAAEAALINSGQVGPTDVSPAWRPYATATTGIELGDSTLALQVRLIELTRRMMSRELELARAWSREAEASQIDTALSPDELINAEGRADSLGRIGRYRGFMTSSREKFADLIEQAAADLRALGLPRSSGEQAVAGQQRRVTESAAAFDQIVEQELQIIDSFQAVIRFVDAHAGTASVKDGMLEFSDPGVQAEYESLLARLE